MLRLAVESAIFPQLLQPGLFVQGCAYTSDHCDAENYNYPTLVRLNPHPTINYPNLITCRESEASITL
jgi:hypothetical protein